MTASGRPEAGRLAYYRCSWKHGTTDEPITLWYEVDHEGSVLRLIEIFPDGRMLCDDIDRYPNRASDFGFGTLIGIDFYDQPFTWPSADDIDPIVTLDAHPLEFIAIWTKGQAK